MSTSTRPTQWQKSSFSGIEAENCVEIAQAETQLLLRESDTPATVLRASPAGLLALIRHTNASQ